MFNRVQQFNNLLFWAVDGRKIVFLDNLKNIFCFLPFCACSVSKFGKSSNMTLSLLCKHSIWISINEEFYAGLESTEIVAKMQTTKDINENVMENEILIFIIYHL
jgi:hypothetical protein